MYSIRINNSVEKDIKENEIIEKIVALHKKYQSLTPQVMIFKKENEYCFEIGIGDPNERSYIIYDIFSEPEKDWLIAFNPIISKADETTIAIFEVNGQKKRELERNIIGFNDVIGEIEYYLVSNCLSDKLDWHAY